jgi:hypothetical protein
VTYCYYIFFIEISYIIMPLFKLIKLSLYSLNNDTFFESSSILYSLLSNFDLCEFFKRLKSLSDMPFLLKFIDSFLEFYKILEKFHLDTISIDEKERLFVFLNKLMLNIQSLYGALFRVFLLLIVSSIYYYFMSSPFTDGVKLRYLPLNLLCKFSLFLGIPWLVYRGMQNLERLLNVFSLWNLCLLIVYFFYSRYYTCFIKGKSAGYEKYFNKFLFFYFFNLILSTLYNILYMPTPSTFLNLSIYSKEFWIQWFFVLFGSKIGILFAVIIIFHHAKNIFTLKGMVENLNKRFNNLPFIKGYLNHLNCLLTNKWINFFVSLTGVFFVHCLFFNVCILETLRVFQGNAFYSFILKIIEFFV